MSFEEHVLSKEKYPVIFQKPKYRLSYLSSFKYCRPRCSVVSRVMWCSHYTPSNCDTGTCSSRFPLVALYHPGQSVGSDFSFRQGNLNRSCCPLRCILLGLFWLFLFRLRNNRIQFPNELLLILKTEYSWRGDLRTTSFSNQELGDLRGWPRWIFPPKISQKNVYSAYSVHAVHSAIGSRMNRMIFRSARKRNSSQKNTNTVCSEYSCSRNSPKNAPQVSVIGIDLTSL